MKNVIIIFLILLSKPLIAQLPFQGNIQYKMVSFTENEKIELNKMQIQFGIGKYLVTIPSIRKNDEEKIKDENIIVDVNKEIAYILNKETLTYKEEKNKENNKWELNKLDSSRKYFNKNVECYLIENNSFIQTYAWIDNNFQMDCGSSICKSSNAPFMIAGKIPLIIEMYSNHQKLIGIYATDINSTPTDSTMFSINNYTLDLDNSTGDSTVQIPNEIADTLNKIEMLNEINNTNSTIINEKKIEEIKKLFDNMSEADKKKLEVRIEEIKKAFENMSEEDKKKMQKAAEKIKSELEKLRKKSKLKN